MNSTANDKKAVPTNIITGFLGVGKTSAIINLLKDKPNDERWAVLVNEFGEIGVDGSLFEGLYPEEQGVYFEEVPGGCMCCSAGLPMQIALSQLLTRAKPDRLIIEPTGLGHPKEVLQILSSSHYQDRLSVQKTITLVDARKLADELYIENDTFNQQILMADVVIGNKLDLYGKGDEENLTDYVRQHGQPQTQVLFSQFAEIQVKLLEGKTKYQFNESAHHHHRNTSKPLVSEQQIPECGYIKAENQGEGFQSVGWRFSAEKVFNYDRLLSLLSDIRADRMKAVFITDAGIFGYNLTPDTLQEIELDECAESRIEIISTSTDDKLESRLIQALNE